MVLVSGNFMILPAAFDRAASLAPVGSAAKIRMAGLMALAAIVTPDIKPPPTIYLPSKHTQFQQRDRNIIRMQKI